MTVGLLVDQLYNSPEHGSKQKAYMVHGQSIKDRRSKMFSLIHLAFYFN